MAFGTGHHETTSSILGELLDKRLIERGPTTGLADKLDVFYAIGRITEAEYKELIELLEDKTIFLFSQQL